MSSIATAADVDFGQYVYISDRFEQQLLEPPAEHLSSLLLGETLPNRTFRAAQIADLATRSELRDLAEKLQIGRSETQLTSLAHLQSLFTPKFESGASFYLSSDSIVEDNFRPISISFEKVSGTQYRRIGNFGEHQGPATSTADSEGWHFFTVDDRSDLSLRVKFTASVANFTWAAKPKKTLSDLAQTLRANHADLASVVASQDHTLSADELKALQSIAMSKLAGALSAAAFGLILASHVLSRHPNNGNQSD